MLKLWKRLFGPSRRDIAEAEVKIVEAALERARGQIEELHRQIRTIEAAVQPWKDQVEVLEKQVAAHSAEATRALRKLGVARATGSQQDERLKHQNNEMRVAMSRTHRHVSAVLEVLQAKEFSWPEDLERAEAVAKAALATWAACNNWLNANKIEPYLGPVPGFDGKTVAEREKEVAHTL